MVSSSYTDEVLSANPWGFWPDAPSGGLLVDGSPNAHNLTVSGSPTVVAGPGDGTTGLLWGNADYAYSPLSTSSGNEQAFECWVYVDSLGPLCEFMAARNSSGGESIDLDLNSSNFYAHSWLTSHNYAIDNRKATANTWHHLVLCSVPSRNWMALYVDGLERASTVAAGSFTRQPWLSAAGSFRMAFPAYYYGSSLTAKQVMDHYGYFAMLSGVWST